jgi:NAD(P)-dependent dehydrogenase (short-subunit alcohol dehydrogenase family)
MAWSTADIPDQTGKVAVVTGANGGLGSHMTRALARAGATVVMAVRDVDRGRTVADAIRAEVVAAALEPRHVDLASLDSITAFAESIRADHAAVDILLNNAGVMAMPTGRTADGFETQVGTNHLGHFVLTSALMPALSRAASARVVTLTSIARLQGRTITYRTTRTGEDYDAWRAYGDSKLANLQFGIELARRLEASGSSVASLVAHPGLSDTGLQATTVRNAGGGLLGRLYLVLAETIGMSPAAGALPGLRAATDQGATSGEFYGPRWLLRGAPVRLRVPARSVASDQTGQMWQVSEAQTGISFDLVG